MGVLDGREPAGGRLQQSVDDGRRQRHIRRHQGPAGGHHATERGHQAADRDRAQEERRLVAAGLLHRAGGGAVREEQPQTQLADPLRRQNGQRVQRHEIPAGLEPAVVRHPAAGRVRRRHPDPHQPPVLRERELLLQPGGDLAERGQVQRLLQLQNGRLLGQPKLQPG